MVMTKADIIQEYKQAKNRRNQITILADQNLISEQEIVDILVAGGCEVPAYKYRKKPNNTFSSAPSKGVKGVKKETVAESETVTIKRTEATRMITEKAALDTIRDFLANPEASWDEFCLYMSGVVDLVCTVSKRCG